MKVLVTGANGLLGSNLVRELMDNQFEVKGMVRKNSKLLSLKGVNPEIFKGSLLHTKDLQQALKNCNIVIHTAANTSQLTLNYEHYKAINVDATHLLLQESLKAGVEKFIFVSSANAFGFGTKENPGNETTPINQMQLQSGYMRSKYEAQKLVLNFHRKHKFPAIVVNPTFMLGKYDSKPSSGQILLMAHGKKIMSIPTGGKNFIHVEDVADGIIQAIEKGKNGASYLLANENLSYREFYSLMQKTCGSPNQLLQIPKPVLAMIGHAGTLYEKIIKSPSKLNHINAQLLCNNNYYSSAKAVKELQLRQTPIEKAIKDALEWFKENGYL